MSLRLFSFLCGLLLSACSTLEVQSDHDPTADFTKYRTYVWLHDEESRPASDISGVPSDLIEHRIRAAIQAQLGIKGLKPIEKGERPDLLVRAQLVQRQKVEASGIGASLGVGYGYGPWYGAVGGPTFPSVRQYTEGTLVIDLIDAGSRRLVWRGIANDATPEPGKSTEQINKVVSETLQKYPPARTGQG